MRCMRCNGSIGPNGMGAPACTCPPPAPLPVTVTLLNVKRGMGLMLAADGQPKENPRLYLSVSEEADYGEAGMTLYTSTSLVIMSDPDGYLSLGTFADYDDDVDITQLFETLARLETGCPPHELWAKARG